MVVLLEFMILSVKQTCALFPGIKIGCHRGEGVYLRKNGFFESTFVFLDKGEFIIFGQYCYFSELDVVSVDAVVALFNVIDFESCRCVPICVQECFQEVSLKLSPSVEQLRLYMLSSSLCLS